MPSLHTQKLARWGRVAVVVAVAVTAVWAFALITPSYELDSEAFLSQVFAQNAEMRSVHITSSGTAAMSNGDVLYWSGEGDIVHTGDSQGHIEYEGCGFPIGKDLYLCSIEWVELGGVRYEKENTSKGLGEWEVVDDVQTQPSHSGTPYDPVDLLEYWSRSYGLVELRGDIDGVEHRLFRASYNPSKRMLERLKAGEWEPPPEVPRDLAIAGLEKQAEVETGTIELWAREDDSTTWNVSLETERLDADNPEYRDSFVPRKTTSILEYSHFNEPVVIKPPI